MMGLGEQRAFEGVPRRYTLSTWRRDPQSLWFAFSADLLQRTRVEGFRETYDSQVVLAGTVLEIFKFL